MKGWIVTSESISTPTSIQVEPGSTIVTPGEHVLLVDPVAQLPRDERELDAGVDSLHLPGHGRGVDGDRLAVADEQPERVGHVELPLRVVRLESVQHGPELVGAEDVDPRVDLAKRTLLRRCVSGLDDARQAAARVAHDAAVRAGVVGLEGEHRRRRAFASVRVDECADQVDGERRHVAVQHEHVAGEAGERILCTADGVARAERRLLHGDLDSGV